ncbi:hypothetical protein [Kangiella geojedonensis]|uniref:DUF4878 domain-containing protein n=1 Tax=Kangiella geojedonensis TaxID=914150 RepID=A0A0F6TQ00_9GAMM|nr:hypothetical protein [Kangiella geojedonensis]AKE51425.1 hypothetical protein TQ33_0439 [Kangiella geojedonensis]
MNLIPWRLCLLLLALTVLLLGCQKATPEEEIQQTLDQMIAIIESGNKDKVLQEYAIIPPNQNISTRDFSDDKAQALLLYLKEAKRTTPIVSEDQTKLRFIVPSSRRELVFQKDDGQWKLNN